MAKKWRVFIDSSALLAGLNSPSGAAGQIIDLHRLGTITIVISEYVVTEIRRSSLYRKPDVRLRFENLLFSKVRILRLPSLRSVTQASTVISPEDAPIIASAKAVRAQALITWDKEFLSKEVEQYINCPVYLPGDFLKMLRSSKKM